MIIDKAQDLVTVSARPLGGQSHGQYKEFIEKNDKAQGFEYSETRHSDAWAKEETTRCLGITSGTALQKYSKIDRDTALIK